MNRNQPLAVNTKFSFRSPNHYGKFSGFDKRVAREDKGVVLWNPLSPKSVDVVTNTHSKLNLGLVKGG